VKVLDTPRLRLREFSLDDDTFILELLNEPGFVRFIGDKGVRTVSDARDYLEKGPMESYRRNGFGLYAVCVRGIEGMAPVGMCGLVKRAGLHDPDIGFAFLARHWGKGYAAESAAAILEHGTRVLQLPRIVAITSPDNMGSIAVLEKIGLTFVRLMSLTEHSHPVKLFERADAQLSA